MALRVGIDLRLFHVLFDRKDQPVTAVEIAEMTRAEVALIGRERMYLLEMQKLRGIFLMSALDEGHYSNRFCKGD